VSIVNSYKTIIIVVIPTNIGILCSSIVYIFVCLFVCLLVARYLKQLDVGDTWLAEWHVLV